MSVRRRRRRLTGLLGFAAAVAVGCQAPPPAAPPPVRGLGLEVTRPGPVAIAVDGSLGPTPLSGRAPQLVAASTVPGCTPLLQVPEWQLERRPWVAPDGRSYDAWWVVGGRHTVVVPSDPACLPGRNGEGTSYLVAAGATTASRRDALPVPAFDEGWLAPDGLSARFTIIK